MAFGALVASAVSGLGASAGSQPEMNSLNSRTQINVQPVGLNIGAIMTPFTENSVHGGVGLLTTAPRFSGASVSSHAPFSAASKLLKKAGDSVAEGGLQVPLAIAAVLLVVSFAFARRGT